MLNFIANTPTTWDDTKALDGKIGEFVVVARRSGDNWYVGGMNDWNEREVEIDFSKILPEDTEYKAEIIRDSVNSNKLARDYKRIQGCGFNHKNENYHEKGGGFAIKLTPKEFEIFEWDCSNI
ncbi:MAG: glycoside hydrolase family 97 C-terminal domain-containing protein [Bacilli bacterium]